MTGPFHDDVGGDAHGEGADDDGAAAGVGADEFSLGLDLVGANVALVGGDADFLVDTSQAAQLLDVAVHRLVGVVREGFAVLEGGVLVFLQNGLGDLVQLDGDAVRRLDGRDLDVVALDVVAAEVVDVGVPDTGPISSRSGNKGWCDNRQGTSSFVICGEIWAFTLVLSARLTDYQFFYGNSEGK